MTDHLEPYRQMARSLRFVPSQGPVEPAYYQLTKLSALEASAPSISAGWTAPDVTVPAPPVDPSQRAEELIRAAVAKPTVLPVTYSILENIGDRISKLAPSQPPKPQPWTPKIPQPGALGWVPSPPAPEPMVTDRPEAIAEPVSNPNSTEANEQQTVVGTTSEAAAAKPVATQSTSGRASASASSKATKTRSKSRKSRSSRKA